MPFWRRLAQAAHARSLWQVFVGYLVTAWVVFQVVMALYDALGLPRWVPPVALVLLLVGLPIVLLTAFVQRAGPSPSNLYDGGSDPTLHPELEPMAPTTLQQRITWRRALLGGVAAFGLLALLTVAYVAMRNLGIGPVGTLMAQGLLAEDDRVILADFRSPADSALGRVVAEALRVDLQQSKVIRLAQPVDIEAELRRMRREAGWLDETAAREVAQRAGLKAVIAGDVARIGAGYTLNARLLTPEGTVLAAFRQSARDSTELLDAVERLSQDVREKIGESLKSIRASAPLEKATTTSLAALRKYTESMKNTDPAESARLAEEAIALDSTFAMAHRRLSAMLFNLRIKQSRQIEAATKAYELRDRLPEIERYHTIALYSNYVAGNPEAAVEAYQHLLSLDSLDPAALNNIALRLHQLGRAAEAERYLQRAIAAAPHPSQYVNLTAAQYRQGKRVETVATLDQGLREYPTHLTLNRQRIFIATFLDQSGHIEKLLSEYEAKLTTPAAKRALLYDRVRFAYWQGQVREADRYGNQQLDRLRRDSLSAEVLIAAAERATFQAVVQGQSAGAAQLLDQALVQTPLEQLDRMGRPYVELASAFAVAHRPDRAQALVSQFEREVPEGRRGEAGYGLVWVKGLIAHERGDYATAIALLRASTAFVTCKDCVLPFIADAFDGLNQPDSARYYREAYINSTDPFRIPTETFALPGLLEKLAQHYETSDPRKAIAYYTRLIERWKNADPELQLRVRAAEARRAALLRQVG